MRNKASIFLLFCLSLLPALAQYQQALPGYHYQFPRDNFNHPDYQTEWWYYTGNLKAADGHRFGFELTFFRQGVKRNGTMPSDWEIRDLYLAHLAVSDLDSGKFYHTERINRSGPGLAGSSEQQSRVWNGNWQVQWKDSQQELSAVTENLSLQLRMASQKPPIIHGENGISQKAAGKGEASHYISYTRLETSGSIQLNGRTYLLEGTSWMDHEFFTNSLGKDQLGWDWMSLQLADHTEIMLYRFRRRDGSIDPFSSGTYVDTQGQSHHLRVEDFKMTPNGVSWNSPATHASYPIEWVVSIPSLNLELTVKTPLQSQELVSANAVSPSYWEGAIIVAGRRNGVPISGLGYLEMTGYAKPITLGKK